MIKKNLTGLDLEVFEETLENGLRIFIIPKKNANNTYVTFSTNYGSVQNDFVPIQEENMISVPLGIAHFLEHKVFEQESGEDPFTFYSERGADANANTTNYKTTYLFSGTEFLEENLNYLLDYVTSPYFTDENVEKEKGIIEQEIKMYEDDPYTRIYEGVIYNAFVNHPIRYPIIGNIESIRKITKEDLYKCYNTFYHPSNMYIVISGKVKPEQAIEWISKNQEKKERKKVEKIKVKEYEEPNEVAKKEERIKLNITIPKVALAYKFPIKDFQVKEKSTLLRYLSLLFDIHFGSTSKLVEKLRREDILNGHIEVDFVDTNEHILVIFFAETKKEEEWIEQIEKELKDLKVEKEELERKKKVLLSSLLYMSDNVYSINHMIMNRINRYHFIDYTILQKIKDVNMDTMKEITEKLNFSNRTLFFVEPKK